MPLAVEIEAERRHLPIPPKYLDQLKNTQQNPRYHAEGNVYQHTLMVLDQYERHIDSFDLTEEEKEILYWTALLHDIGKPKVTQWSNGRWTAAGHERAGVPLARTLLLSRPELTQEQRRRILSLIRWHHIPLRWGLQKLPINAYKYVATHTDLRLLGIFSLFDVRGRICENQDAVLRLIDHFNDVIVPIVEEELGDFDHMQFCFKQANLVQKNLIWKALQARDFKQVAKTLDQSVKPLSSFSHPQTCYITIGSPFSGKTAYIQKNFSGHPYFDMSRFEPIVPEHFEKENYLTGIPELKSFLQSYIPQGRSVVVDGRNLCDSRRQSVTEYARVLGANIQYLFFDRSLEEVMDNNRQAASPLCVRDLRESYESLQLPHPWEAHKLTIVDQ